jgi:hypothetical protein
MKTSTKIIVAIAALVCAVPIVRGSFSLYREYVEGLKPLWVSQEEGTSYSDFLAKKAMTPAELEIVSKPLNAADQRAKAERIVQAVSKGGSKVVGLFTAKLQQRRQKRHPRRNDHTRHGRGRGGQYERIRSRRRSHGQSKPPEVGQQHLRLP